MPTSRQATIGTLDLVLVIAPMAADEERAEAPHERLFGPRRPSLSLDEEIAIHDIGPTRK